MSSTFLPNIPKPKVNDNIQDAKENENTCESETVSDESIIVMRENDENPSRSSSKLLPISTCPRELSSNDIYSCRKPEIPISSSQSNTMQLAQRKESNPFSLFCGATISGGIINLNIYSGKRKHAYDDNSSQEF